MTDEQRQMMMIDIDEILIRYESNIDDLLICAEAMYLSAAGQLSDQMKASDKSWKRKMEKFAKLVCERLYERLANRIEASRVNDVIFN